MTNVISIWGKGGVGKTTCAASIAVRLSTMGLKTLILTNDPMPSLSDIFKKEVGVTPTPISEPNLYAMAIDDKNTVRLWKEKYGNDVYEVISSFLPVDESIIDYVASAPLIGEEFMLALLKEIKESNEFDVIVWDTAPAGGSLKLIKLEKMFYEHLGAAAKLYLSVKSTFQKLIRRKKRDPLTLIESWKGLANEILEMVCKEDFHVYIVTIAEWLGFAETLRILDNFNEFNIKPYGLIINRILRKNDDCNCTLCLRSAEINERYLKKFYDVLGNELNIYEVPFIGEEIYGLNTLLSFSEHLKSLIDFEAKKIVL
ncbi:MAG: ArsA family ATPase [Candidatus Asgardarchaeia archaeon]